MKQLIIDKSNIFPDIADMPNVIYIPHKQFKNIELSLYTFWDKTIYIGIYHNTYANITKHIHETTHFKSSIFEII